MSMHSLLVAVLSVIVLRHEQKQIIERYARSMNMCAREAGLGTNYVERSVDFPMRKLRKAWVETESKLASMLYVRNDPKGMEERLEEAFSEIVVAESILEVFIARECDTLLRRSTEEAERHIKSQSRMLFANTETAQRSLLAHRQKLDERSIRKKVQASLVTEGGAEEAIRYIEDRVSSLKEIKKEIQTVPMWTRVVVLGAIATIFGLLLRLTGIF